MTEMSPPPTQAPPASPPPAGPPQGNGIAVAGMVLGIISLVLFCIWFLSIPCAIVGLILSLIGMKKAKVVGKGRGMAMTGLITSLIAVGLAVLYVILILVGVATLQFNSSTSTTAPAEELISILRLRF